MKVKSLCNNMFLIFFGQILFFFFLSGVSFAYYIRCVVPSVPPYTLIIPWRPMMIEPTCRCRFCELWRRLLCERSKFGSKRGEWMRHVTFCWTRFLHCFLQEKIYILKRPVIGFANKINAIADSLSRLVLNLGEVERFGMDVLQ